MCVNREFIRRSMDANSRYRDRLAMVLHNLGSNLPDVLGHAREKSLRRKERMATHPNCRCTMLPVLSRIGNWGFQLMSQSNIRTYERSGRTFSKISHWSFSKRCFGPAAFRAYKLELFDLPDFIGEVNNPVWGQTRYAKSLSQILGRGKAKTFYTQPSSGRRSQNRAL